MALGLLPAIDSSGSSRSWNDAISSCGGGEETKRSSRRPFGPSWVSTRSGTDSSRLLVAHISFHATHTLSWPHTQAEARTVSSLLTLPEDRLEDRIAHIEMALPGSVPRLCCIASLAASSFGGGRTTYSLNHFSMLDEFNRDIKIDARHSRVGYVWLAPVARVGAHPIGLAAHVGFDQFQHRPQLLLIVGLLVNLCGHVSPAWWQPFSWCFRKTPRSPRPQAISREPL